MLDHVALHKSGLHRWPPTDASAHDPGPCDPSYIDPFYMKITQRFTWQGAARRMGGTSGARLAWGAVRSRLRGSSQRFGPRRLLRSHEIFVKKIRLAGKSRTTGSDQRSTASAGTAYNVGRTARVYGCVPYPPVALSQGTVKRAGHLCRRNNLALHCNIWLTPRRGTSHGQNVHGACLPAAGKPSAVAASADGVLG